MKVWLLVQELVAGWGRHLRGRAAIYLAVLAALISFAFFSVPRDETWVAWISHNQHEHLDLARAISHWGDFRGTLIIAALLLTMSVVTKKARFRRLAFAALLAAAFAGLAANIGRVVVGRPRPVSDLPDGLYGPTFKYKRHSFPSAHSAAAGATASTLLAAWPLIGVPAVGACAAVMWSRIYLRNHHVTDVLFGAYLGALFGIGLGLTARRDEDETFESPKTPAGSRS